LAGANLRSVDLTGANLAGADLRSADLRYAKLDGADLTGAKLLGTNLYGASIENAQIEVSTTTYLDEGAIERTFPWDPAEDVFSVADAAGFGGNIGLSVGGAKDINNFRGNVEESFLPLVTDVTYEGIFYDYFFDLGGSDEACETLFCPTYSFAVSPDPVTGGARSFLSVGLKSNIKASDFARPRLDLVIVLDVSGSMGSAFNRYYYDDPGAANDEEDDDWKKTKMAIARESVLHLLDHLQPDDKLGIVLFNNGALEFLALSQFGSLDEGSLRQRIAGIEHGGGTNMGAGMQLGTRMLEDLPGRDPIAEERRIIFLTDAQPNTGTTSREGLAGIASANAAEGIYSTFIGIGVDFNTDLIESISDTEGANYYAVHSPDSFRDRMNSGFQYMVSPLVFDLQLTLSGVTINEVYGSPQADASTGSILKVASLFPSESTEEGVRGGVILADIDTSSDDPAINGVKLKVSYRDRAGQVHGAETEVALEHSGEHVFPSTGFRKAVLLSRYATLIQNWITEERAQYAEEPIQPKEFPGEDWPVLPWTFKLSQWERTSLPLFVSQLHRDRMTTFRDHFALEMESLGDESLQQEFHVLDRLIGHQVPPGQEKEEP
jgi:Ca-activated chloride channel family protein